MAEKITPLTGKVGLNNQGISEDELQGLAEAVVGGRLP